MVNGFSKDMVKPTQCSLFDNRGGRFDATAVVVHIKISDSIEASNPQDSLQKAVVKDSQITEMNCLQWPSLDCIEENRPNNRFVDRHFCLHADLPPIP